jgi:hypothetical protein
MHVVALSKLKRMDEAKSALTELLSRWPKFSIEFVLSNFPGSTSRQIDPYIDSLREADVPEE